MAAKASGVLEIGAGRTRVRLTWRWFGRDLHVQIGGGAEHIGAVALCGRADHGEGADGVLVVPPHKEGAMAARAARELHDRLGCIVCVTGGVHIDAITREEIHEVLKHAEEGILRLAELLTARDDATP